MYSDGVNWIFMAHAQYAFNGQLSSPVVLNAPSIRISNTDITTLFQPRSWVQCVVNGPTISIQAGSDVGRVTPTITRTNGQAVGAYDVGFSTHPRGFNYTYCLQPGADAGLVFAVISNVNASSLKVRTYNAAEALTDLQFSITIFS